MDKIWNNFFGDEVAVQPVPEYAPRFEFETVIDVVQVHVDAPVQINHGRGIHVTPIRGSRAGDTAGGAPQLNGIVSHEEDPFTGVGHCGRQHSGQHYKAIQK